MAQQIINVGSIANDHTGDKLRAAFVKTKANFSELYGFAGNLSGLTNASAARSNLGVAIGINVQAFSALLNQWAAKSLPAGAVVGTNDNQTLTNKIINASSNTLSNLTTAMFAANVIDTDANLAANSDGRLSSQKATKTYIDGLLAANDAEVFKGVIDCSGNPNYPAADAGHSYRISVAGKIGGASGANVEIGDFLICITDATAAGTQAAVGSHWAIIQTNIDGAVIGPASVTDGHFAQFDGASGKLIKGGLALDTDTALAANSDTRVPSQKAVKAYVAAAAPVLSVAGRAGAVTLAQADVSGLTTASSPIFAGMALRNGTNPTLFDLYNSYTDASNYERGFLDWASNELRVGTVKAGTGTARNVGIWREGTQYILVDAGGVRVANHLAFASTTAGSTLFGQAYTLSDGVFTFYNGATTSQASLSHNAWVAAQATTPYNTVANGDCNKIFTNEGASALIVHNLPSAAAKLGPFTYVVQDTDGIQVNAAAGDTIRIAGSVTPAAGNISSTTVGSVVVLIAINATEWIAIQVVGTWAVSS